MPDEAVMTLAELEKFEQVVRAARERELLQPDFIGTVVMQTDTAAALANTIRRLRSALAYLKHATDTACANAGELLAQLEGRA